MKLRNGTENTLNAIVAPLVGAWIEIISAPTAFEESVVAPLVGAWIEMYINVCVINRTKSLPSWERGLKYILALSK